MTSPTFTILNVYEDGRLKLNHLDMYRVESSDELAELGIEECFDEDAVTVIEWNKFEHFDGKVIKISVKTLGETKREYDIVLQQDENGKTISDVDAETVKTDEKKSDDVNGEKAEN